MIECCGSIPLFVEVFPAELFQLQVVFGIFSLEFNL